MVLNYPQGKLYLWKDVLHILVLEDKFDFDLLKLEHIKLEEFPTANPKILKSLLPQYIKEECGLKGAFVYRLLLEMKRIFS